MFQSSWFVYSIITSILWGAWGFLGKLASRSMSAQTLLFLSTIGWVITLPVIYYLFKHNFKIALNHPDFYWAILSGVLGSLGSAFFYFALAKGEASRVVAITAAYPLITAILAVGFLNEQITVNKFVGLFLAILGVIFLSR